MSVIGKNGLLIGFKEGQGVSHRLDVGPGGNGRPGKLVDFTAVFLHIPGLVITALKLFADKAVHPIRFLALNLVTQPRGFLVRQRANTKHSAICLDTYDQAYFTIVAIRRYGFDGNSDRLGILGGDIAGMG